MSPLLYSQNCYFKINGKIAIIVDKDNIEEDFGGVYDSCRANCGNQIQSKFKYIKSKYPNSNNVKVNINKSSLCINLSGYDKKDAAENKEQLSQLFDAIVGNTCVLLNPKDWNKVNNNAGKINKTGHNSFDYLTVNSFWIRQHQLFSFLTGMMRFALHIIQQNNDKVENKSYIKKINELVTPENINNAVLNNDPILARKNFDKLKDFIVELAGNNGYSYPISKESIKYFVYFIDKIESDGIAYWFKHNIFRFWTTKYLESHDRSIEKFLQLEVKSDMNGKRIELMP